MQAVRCEQCGFFCLTEKPKIDYVEYCPICSGITFRQNMSDKDVQNLRQYLKDYFQSGRIN
jgi:hypothetical protein